MKESLPAQDPHAVIAIVRVDDADLVRSQVHESDNVSASAGVELAEADDHAMILPQCRKENFRAELTPFLDLIGDALFRQDLLKILGTSQSSVLIGETKEASDTLVPAHGLQGAPAATAWWLIAYTTFDGNIDLCPHFHRGHPKQQSRQQREYSRHGYPSQGEKIGMPSLAQWAT